MDEKEKQAYLEHYHQEKEKGVPFFPDILFKDIIISLIVFLALIALSYFPGSPLEARADPADTSYNPRPEWYFLFLFQLFKYFPGKIEVIGVVVIPTVAILLLLILPLLDHSAHRFYLRRLWVMAVTSLGLIGAVVLTILSIREAPPPAEITSGDQTAALYAKNCAPCHGSTISVAEGANLHAVIAQGKHEGMPAWSADLTTDEIDALAGFILSPAGSQLFTQNCESCHEISELVAGDPLQIKASLDEGTDYPPHADLEAPNWTEVMKPEERTSLLNFLVAADGQRLYAINCYACHGRSVAFSGEQEQLSTIISQGGLHLEMPPWQQELSSSEIDTLARYVTNPAGVPEGPRIFQQFCSSCHGERIPTASDFDQARQTITSGGPHQTMPVWGNVLTSEQLDALVTYTFNASKGTSLEAGQELFLENCASCHGEFGEGGPNPARSDDVIAPISTAEFLKTRDDFTLRAIIARGQPNFGMSPFGTAFGGPLESDEVDAVVAYLRSWESNPPVELPPEVAASLVSLSGEAIFAEVCAQCHGANGEGGVGPSFQDAKFQAGKTDQDIFDIINLGHKITSMIAWGEILTSDQIQQLVDFIRQLGLVAPAETPAAPPTFEADVLPIFEKKCIICHGSLGGWDASTYEATMTTGDHAPVVIGGDAQNSLLAQKILGTHTQGTIMPPGGKMSDAEIQVILDWIGAGAPQR